MRRRPGLQLGDHAGWGPRGGRVRSGRGVAVAAPAAAAARLQGRLGEEQILWVQANFPFFFVSSVFFGLFVFFAGETFYLSSALK